MPKRKARTIQQRIPGIRRERAHLAVHPDIKRELQRMARYHRCSVSYLLARLIIRYWNWDDLDPDDRDPFA